MLCVSVKVSAPVTVIPQNFQKQVEEQLFGVRLWLIEVKSCFVFHQTPFVISSVENGSSDQTLEKNCCEN